MSYETLNKALGVIVRLEAELADARERLRKVLVVCECDACTELRDAIDAARGVKP